MVGNLTIKRTDFIRKKWLDNDFYGAVSTLYGKFENLDLNFGIVGNQYEGKHFGNVSAVYYPEIFEHEYYRNNGVKKELAGFAKAIIKINKIELYGDVQLRNIKYNTSVILQGDNEGVNLDKNWLFFNPKAGINYRINSGKLFFSYAHAHREPNRDDIFSNIEIQPEKLHDFEAGLEKAFGPVSFTTNLYYMNYVNQLVLNGQINDIGEFIRVNSGKSYRMGIEVGALAKLSDQWKVSGNFTLSKNENKDFTNETSDGFENLGDTPISFSPNIIGNVLINYAPTTNFSLGLQNQYVGRQFLDNTNDENLRLNDYLLTDFNIGYTLNLRQTEVDFKLLINNLLNKKYINNGFVYDQSPLYFAQAGTNFMFGMSLRLK